jgi:hypothetical protein
MAAMSGKVLIDKCPMTGVATDMCFGSVPVSASHFAWSARPEWIGAAGRYTGLTGVQVGPPTCHQDAFVKSSQTASFLLIDYKYTFFLLD